MFPGFHPRYHIPLSHHVSLFPLGLDSFSDFSCYLRILIVSKSTGQVFGRIALNLATSVVFLMVRQGLLVLRTNTMTYSVILITSCQRYISSIRLISENVKLDPLAKAFVMFLHC